MKKKLTKVVSARLLNTTDSKFKAIAKLKKIKHATLLRDLILLYVKKESKKLKKRNEKL